jgi:hypothetical protein
MVVNDDAGHLNPRSALGLFASTLAPTEYRGHTAGLPDIPRYKLNALFSCQLV